MNDMLGEVRALVERHCASLRAELVVIEASLSDLDSYEGGVMRQQIGDAIAHAHKIKGSSGSIGFADISASAATLERNLRQAHAGSVDDPGVRQTLKDSLSDLSAKVNNVRPESSRLWNADFSSFGH